MHGLILEIGLVILYHISKAKNTVFTVTWATSKVGGLTLFVISNLSKYWEIL